MTNEIVLIDECLGMTGDNPGCGTYGFPAHIGWDPVCNAMVWFSACHQYRLCRSLVWGHPISRDSSLLPVFKSHCHFLGHLEPQTIWDRASERAHGNQRTMLCCRACLEYSIVAVVRLWPLNPDFVARCVEVRKSREMGRLLVPRATSPRASERPG